MFVSFPPYCKMGVACGTRCQRGRWPMTCRWPRGASFVAALRWVMLLSQVGLNLTPMNFENEYD